MGNYVKVTPKGGGKGNRFHRGLGRFGELKFKTVGLNVESKGEPWLEPER